MTELYQSYSGTELLTEIERDTDTATDTAIDRATNSYRATEFRKSRGVWQVFPATFAKLTDSLHSITTDELCNSI